MKNITMGKYIIGRDWQRTHSLCRVSFSHSDWGVELGYFRVVADIKRNKEKKTQLGYPELCHNRIGLFLFCVEFGWGWGWIKLFIVWRKKCFVLVKIKFWGLGSVWGCVGVGIGKKIWVPNSISIKAVGWRKIKPTLDQPTGPSVAIGKQF